MPIISDSSDVYILWYYHKGRTIYGASRLFYEALQHDLKVGYAAFSELAALGFRVPPKV